MLPEWLARTFVILGAGMVGFAIRPDTKGVLVGLGIGCLMAGLSGIARHMLEGRCG